MLRIGDDVAGSGSSAAGNPVAGSLKEEICPIFSLTPVMITTSKRPARHAVDGGLGVERSQEMF